MGKKPEDKPAETETPKAATVQSLVATLVMNVDLSYQQIADMVRSEIPRANTSTRSVASIASRLRKAGVDVPTRRASKQADA